MDNVEIKDLSKYRLEQAKENLDEAKILFDNGKFKGASNRAYYSIFHSMKSILALEQKDFKKHSSVIAYFNQNYINKGVFPKDLGKGINFARLYREKSDYVDFYIVTKEETEAQMKTAKTLIEHIEKYITEFFK
jgi:uncharacterized protein (UPF0332 family)